MFPSLISSAIAIQILTNWLFHVEFQARPLLTQALEGRSFNELVDPRLEEYNSAEMAQMVACAAVCVRSSARRRPQMSQVNLLESRIYLLSITLKWIF